jgi:multifunctional methyltransferase subunit TRM112
VGDTSLPLEQPEMLDDDFLKTLHHVLLEVIDTFLNP